MTHIFRRASFALILLAAACTPVPPKPEPVPTPPKPSAGPESALYQEVAFDTLPGWTQAALVPKGFLSKILGELRAADIVSAQRGYHGGYGGHYYGGHYYGHDNGGAAVAAGVVGLANGAGKLAFDSLVQRDAPASMRGRVFARFEAMFQLVWVVGALVPVAITMSDQVGAWVIAAVTMIAAGFYTAVRLRPDLAGPRRRPEPAPLDSAASVAP